MIGCADHNHVAWQCINLHQEGADNALNLTCFMNVSSFFSECFKLVKKKNAFARGSEFKELPQADCGFAQIGSDYAVITYDKERDQECFCNSLC